MPYPSDSETAAGIAAVESDRLLINEKITPTATMNTTIAITKFLVPLSPLLDAICSHSPLFV